MTSQATLLLMQWAQGKNLEQQHAFADYLERSYHLEMTRGAINRASMEVIISDFERQN